MKSSFSCLIDSSLSLQEQRDVIVRDYHESGREERDQLFRERLKDGPQVRRYLNWGGAKVRVIEAVKGPGAPLCPTDWIYRWVSTNWLGPDYIVESPEINFCDDCDVLDLLFPWHSGLRDKLAIELSQSSPDWYVGAYI